MDDRYSTKHETLATQCWSDVGTSSKTVFRHSTNTGPAGHLTASVHCAITRPEIIMFVDKIADRLRVLGYT